MLRGKNAQYWADTLARLRKADISSIRKQLPTGQETFFKALETSFQSLGPEMQEQYKTLAVLLEDIPAPLPILATLWNVDTSDARLISARLVERAISYFFLPKKAKPPYQTVLFFPGSNALLLRKFALYPTAALDAVLRSGRAVIYPVYKSTYEHGDGMETDVPDSSSNWRDHVVMWVKDASRALDYADTRPDLDHAKIGYYGYSWGAVMGAIIPAVDLRFKANVLALGGMEYSQSLPEVDKINFLPRVTQPTLMLNGHYDFFFPVDSTQIPFYNLLGAKKDQKKRIQYETGHNIPRNELIKETLNWFDVWLGPVQ